jgi:hypothetical protein
LIELARGEQLYNTTLYNQSNTKANAD